MRILHSQRVQLLVGERVAIWSLAIRNRSGPIPRQEQLEVVDARDGVRRPIREEPNDRDRKRKRASTERSDDSRYEVGPESHAG